jgi:hypothetical protein
MTPQHINIIQKYLRIFKGKENEIKVLIQDLINIAQGDVVELMTLEMKITFFERSEKKEQGSK